MSNDIVPHDLMPYIVMSRPHLAGIQVVLRFPNNFGVSLIAGPLISRFKGAPFEIAALQFHGDDFTTVDVDEELLQHQTKSECYQYIYKVMQWKAGLIPYNPKEDPT